MDEDRNAATHMQDNAAREERLDGEEGKNDVSWG